MAEKQHVTYQRAALPPRTDLTTRRKRVAATSAVHVEGLYERLKSRVLADITPPQDDPFSTAPDKLEACRPGEILDDRLLYSAGG